MPRNIQAADPGPFVTASPAPDIVPSVGADGTSRDPVAKTFRLLNHLVDSDDKSWTVRALAIELDAPVSSVHRMLAGLSRAGVLEQDEETAGYEFSADFHRIARRVISRFPLPELAREQLQEIAVATGETTLLGLLDGETNRMSFVSQAEGGHELRYVIPLHTWMSLARGASGLAILSFLDESRRTTAIEEHAAAHDQPSAEQIRADIELTRSRGYALSHGQRINGATGIAAPIFNAHGRVIGDLVVTMPLVRFSAVDEADLVGRVVRGAETLTRLLGGDPLLWKEIR